MQCEYASYSRQQSKSNLEIHYLPQPQKVNLGKSTLMYTTNTAPFTWKKEVSAPGSI